MVHIIHHNDLDGYISGDILKIHYPNAKCYSVNYDNPDLLPKKECFSIGDVVFMVDYTIENVGMMNWLKDNTDLYWIDHHVSSLEKQEKNGWKDIKGIRKSGLCGAELVWKIANKGMSIPRFVEMVGEYDTFRSASSNPKFHNDTVLPFFFGTQTCFDKMKPENYNNNDFMFHSNSELYNNALVDKMIAIGQYIYAFQKETGTVENACNCFVRNIWGYRVLCMNSCSRGSTQFTIPETWNPDKHDMMLIYYYNGNKWAYGFYTEKDDVDVSKIAINLGGGGHQKAAGACSDSLLDELK